MNISRCFGCIYLKLQPKHTKEFATVVRLHHNFHLKTISFSISRLGNNKKLLAQKASNVSYKTLHAFTNDLDKNKLRENTFRWGKEWKC